MVRMTYHFNMGIKGTRLSMEKESIQTEHKRIRNNDEHSNLCVLAGNWLRQSGRISPPACKFTAVEMVSMNQETPDVFGFNSWVTVLIEVKVSRSDFFADRKKYFRIHPEIGMGGLRFYCCPEGLIKPEEIPENWGLLYEIDGKIKKIKDAKYQENDLKAALTFMYSILRREVPNPKLLNYKK